MDPFVLAYYAFICALLGLYAPQMGGRLMRLVIGALVGVGAAVILPWVQSMI